jgi:hypothetical protein
MAYYPKSQIKLGLYTNGEEYTLIPPPNNINAIEYVGYYYQTSNGTRFTGKTPQDGPSQVLYPINNKTTPFENIQAKKFISVIEYSNSLSYIQGNINNNQYLRIKNSPPIPRTIPPFNQTLPTQNDYNLGVFSRYFCKKNNENRYIEIDQTTYQDLNNKKSTIAWDLYTSITTLWYLTGDKTTVAKANKGLVNLIEKNQKWYGFSHYLKDNFTQYYLES